MPAARWRVGGARGLARTRRAGATARQPARPAGLHPGDRGHRGREQRVSARRRAGRLTHRRRTGHGLHRWHGLWWGLRRRHGLHGRHRRHRRDQLTDHAATSHRTTRCALTVHHAFAGGLVLRRQIGAAFHGVFHAGFGCRTRRAVDALGANRPSFAQAAGAFVLRVAAHASRTVLLIGGLCPGARTGQGAGRHQGGAEQKSGLCFHGVPCRATGVCVRPTSSTHATPVGV